jgi:DNA-binding LacI/PurR family transcriptional regulator
MIKSLSDLSSIQTQAPLVSQIKLSLRAQIQAGDLEPGTKLPSLAQLAEHFDCSLGLVRQAINTLIAEGLLTSQPRKGVFVSEKRVAVSDIMLVTPTAHMENMQRIFEGARLGFEQTPYRLVLHAANFDYDQQMAMVDELDPQHVAGVLVLPPPFTEQARPLVNLSQQGIPVVQIARSVQGLDLDAVVADGVAMGQKAIEHLLENGHRRIGYVCNHADYHFNRELFEGFTLGLASHGMSLGELAVTHVSATELNAEQPWQNGQVAASELLSEQPDLTAIIGMNPHITLGVYKAIESAGKKVASDISVLGLFSDLSFFSALSPAVSVVCCDLKQIGQRAALQLLGRIENPSLPRRTVCLLSELISRESVVRIS